MEECENVGLAQQVEAQVVVLPICALPHGEGLPVPCYATAGSAGVDLYAAVGEPVTIAPKGGTLAVPTGFCMQLPTGYEAQVRSRSGLAANYGVVVLNAPGTIDSDYRGEIKVLLINTSDKPFVVERGMRIAQMVIAPVTQVVFHPVGALSESQRGQGGFGSTGLR